MQIGNFPTAPYGRPFRARQSGTDHLDQSAGGRGSADWEVALRRLEGAYSPHTLRSYRADFSGFLEWCTANDSVALPAAPAVIAAYMTAEMQRLRPVTLKRRLCGIRKVHRLLGYPDPPDDVEVELALRRAQRLRPQRPSQALGITAALRDRLLGACREDLAGLRDRALIAVGFETLCRRGELVAIRVEDLEPNHFGSLSVLVRRAKNDPDGTGRIAHLSAPTVAIVAAWLTAARITAGPLFRPVYRGVPVERHLHPLTVTRVLKRLAARAGLEPAEVARISGYSLRVGAAQQLTMNGVQLLPIMRAGGWRSVNVVARYVESVDVNVWG